MCNSQQKQNNKLRSILALGNLEGVKMRRDKYNNITVIKNPSVLKDSYIVGIDEAGRGPVAGPMVYGMVYWGEDPSSKLYNDSKKVGKQKREQQYADLYANSDVGFIICCLSPLFISMNMLCNKKDKEAKSLASGSSKKKKLKENPKKAIVSKGIMAYLKTIKGKVTEDVIEYMNNAIQVAEPEFVCAHRLNLNEISIECIISMLTRCISMGVPVKNIYIDTVGNKGALREKVAEKTKHCPTIKSIVVEDKADSKYQCVGAASILAKVTRDMFLETPEIWECLYNNTAYPKHAVSGYPSDVHTKAWMKQAFVPHIGFPPIFRIGWKPVLDFLTKKRPEDLTPPPHEKGEMLCYIKKASKKA
ncbi:ribonuclease H2 subunit A [Nematocida major]|uniref:ribonuclease H2 subunit A n=1 Tax=Nematocida major TaxID=1912982 RepID=UPI00200724EB|nr:ribonuclease H2 subunit A [Nematocida major]KAH9386872.1 ribonuclease H2 subunit A [Nematocida major]